MVLLTDSAVLCFDFTVSCRCMCMLAQNWELRLPLPRRLKVTRTAEQDCYPHQSTSDIAQLAMGRGPGGWGGEGGGEVWAMRFSVLYQHVHAAPVSRAI